MNERETGMPKATKHASHSALIPFSGWGRIRQAAIYAGVEPRMVRTWIDNGLRCARLNQKTILIRYADIDEYLTQFIDDGSGPDELFSDLA
jgi:hypothetical protein